MLKSTHLTLPAYGSWGLLVISTLYVVARLVLGKVSQTVVSFRGIGIQIAPNFYDAVHIVTLLPYYLLFLASFVLLLSVCHFVVCYRRKVVFFALSWLMGAVGNYYLWDKITAPEIYLPELSIDIKNPIARDGWNLTISFNPGEVAEKFSLIPSAVLLLLSLGLFFVTLWLWKKKATFEPKKEMQEPF